MPNGHERDRQDPYAWSPRKEPSYVTHGKLYLTAGTAIAIAVAAATSLLALHVSSETEHRQALERQVDSLRATVEDGFRETRADIKELLRKR